MAETSGIRSLIRTAIGLQVRNVSNLMVQVLPALAAEPTEPSTERERASDA